MELDAITKTEFGSEKIRGILAQTFFNLTQKWQLKREEEAQLLGWNYKEKRTTLDSLRNGNTILDNDRDKLERIVDLVNIHKSLRILFPHNLDAVYEWVTVKRERFGGYSALEVMLEDGKEGIHAIRFYLDYERTR
ncbi:MAG: hypothetical protein HYU97_03660 [Deltaproteobacteria bacterium]|nr:hypothetical protein [Deltaproteobacteria bacterium]